MNNISLLHCVLLSCSLVLSAVCFQKGGQNLNWIDIQSQKKEEEKRRGAGDRKGEKERKRKEK